MNRLDVIHEQPVIFKEVELELQYLNTTLLRTTAAYNFVVTHKKACQFLSTEKALPDSVCCLKKLVLIICYASRKMKNETQRNSRVKCICHKTTYRYFSPFQTIFRSFEPPLIGESGLKRVERIISKFQFSINFQFKL